MADASAVVYSCLRRLPASARRDRIAADLEKVAISGNIYRIGPLGKKGNK